MRILTSGRTSFVHRADLLRILFAKATSLGVDVQMDKWLVAIGETSFGVEVTLNDLTVMKASLVLGADGMQLCSAIVQPSVSQRTHFTNRHRIDDPSLNFP